MNNVIIILLILLTLSIINNYIMYKYGIQKECNKLYVKSSQFPDNIKFKTITFFYKNKPFKKCIKEDYLLKEVPDRNDGEVEIESIIKKLNNNKITSIINEDNSNELHISQVNHSKIKNLY